jgi:DNA-binding CsgD family transcriptional regulator
MGLDFASVAQAGFHPPDRDWATRSGWLAVARALGGLVERPVLVLDENFVIEFVNERAALLLGTSSRRLEGTNFVEAFVTPQAAAHTETAVVAAVGRPEATLQIPVAADDGRLLSLMVDVHPVAGGLRCLVVSAHCDITPCEAASPPDVAFEVSTDPNSWGAVTRVYRRSEGLSTLQRGTCCYESVGHSTPPTDCPIARWSEGDGESRTVTSTCVPGHVLVATVRASAPGRVLVSGRLVTLGVLGALADAKIDELSARGSLTKREREVLVELVKSGDSLDVIADRLGIRPTTVKFHEANLIEKLGADSRIDLFRLIF